MVTLKKIVVGPHESDAIAQIILSSYIIVFYVLQLTKIVKKMFMLNILVCFSKQMMDFSRHRVKRWHQVRLK